MCIWWKIQISSLLKIHLIYKLNLQFCKTYVLYQPCSVILRLGDCELNGVLLNWAAQSIWAERERQEKAPNAQGISRTPLSAPFPLRNPPLHAPLMLHRFLWPPLTALFPLTQFSARSAPFPAPLTLHLFSIAIVSVPQKDLYFYFHYCNL